MPVTLDRRKKATVGEVLAKKTATPADPELFLKELDEALSHCDNLADVLATWELLCPDDVRDQLFPPDQDEALSIWEKHEARVAEARRTEIAMRRKGGTLTSVDQVSDDELRNAAREGQDVLVVVRTARNPRQHRLAWALAQKIADAADFKDRDDAMDFLKIKARHVRYIADPRTGEVHIIPKSIAFASCSQAAFNRLMNRFVWVVCSEILPGRGRG